MPKALSRESSYESNENDETEVIYVYFDYFIVCSRQRILNAGVALNLRQIKLSLLLHFMLNL